MSNAAAVQSQLPDANTAYNTLFNNVFANTFFTKLAALGYVPENQKQAQILLELSGKLEAVENDPAVKSAGDAGFYGQASTQLDRYLASTGLDGNIKRASAAERENGMAQYAAQLMQQPDIYNAVLSLKAAEASELAASMR